MTVSDATTYEEYVTARWAALYRTAHLLTGDSASAEDLLQSTLVKAFVNWAKVSRAESPDAYVKRMLLNELLSDKRKSARRGRRAHLILAEDPPSTDPTDRLDLWSRLAELAPRQRAVLVLRYYEDLSEAQIAEVLGVSTGTVKSAAHAALRALRSRLTDSSEVTP